MRSGSLFLCEGGQAYLYKRHREELHWRSKTYLIRHREELHLTPSLIPNHALCNSVAIYHC